MRLLTERGEASVMLQTKNSVSTLQHKMDGLVQDRWGLESLMDLIDGIYRLYKTRFAGRNDMKHLWGFPDLLRYRYSVHSCSNRDSATRSFA